MPKSWIDWAEFFCVHPWVVGGIKAKKFKKTFSAFFSRATLGPSASIFYIYMYIYFIYIYEMYLLCYMHVCIYISTYQDKRRILVGWTMAGAASRALDQLLKPWIRRTGPWKTPDQLGNIWKRSLDHRRIFNKKYKNMSMNLGPGWTMNSVCSTRIVWQLNQRRQKPF